MSITIHEIPKSERVRTAIHALRNAATVDSPEATFMLAIVESAIRDLASGRSGDAHTAWTYLRKPKCWHLELVGVDTEYMHRVLKELDIMVLDKSTYPKRIKHD